MLLTKPLSTFLNANRSPQIHTLLLTTATGRLLSSSSSIPASTLRGYATVACSLWAMYKPLTDTGTVTAALPSPQIHSDEEDDDDDDDDDDAPLSSDPDISGILIQLETGTMVIRAMRCSLLFVAMGPSPPATSSRGLSQGLSYLSIASTASPPTSSHSQANGEGPERRQDSSSTNGNGLGSSATSPTRTTTAPAGGSIKLIRRQAEELAKWLDGELEGLSLSSGF